MSGRVGGCGWVYACACVRACARERVYEFVSMRVCVSRTTPPAPHSPLFFYDPPRKCRTLRFIYIYIYR